MRFHYDAAPMHPQSVRYTIQPVASNSHHQQNMCCSLLRQVATSPIPPYTCMTVIFTRTCQGGRVLFFTLLSLESLGLGVILEWNLEVSVSPRHSNGFVYIDENCFKVNVRINLTGRLHRFLSLMDLMRKTVAELLFIEHLDWMDVRIWIQI